MKTRILAAAAALMIAGSANAQDTKSATQIAQPLGIVTKDTIVVTIANKGVLNKHAAGTKCTLYKGDTVVIVGVADGKQIVQRTAMSAAKRGVKGNLFSSESCKVNNPVVADTPDVNAWQKAAEAAEAEKASKQVGQPKKKS